MAYTFKQNLVASSKHSIKCPYAMTAEYIVVHNTANNASAENEIKYMISNDNEVSFHFAVDDKEVIQGLPVDRNAWHAGDGRSGTGNRKGIGVEICYSLSGGSKFDAAEKNAAAFIASLLKERGWGIEKVKRHHDFATNKKYCPHRTMDLGWERFLNMIKANLSTTTTSTTTTSTTPSNSFLVEIICLELNIRKEASFASAIVGTVKKGEVFTIVDEKNGLYKLKSGVGWISAGPAYTKKK